MRFERASLVCLCIAAASAACGNTGDTCGTWVGDGFCDAANNNFDCNWDGGDCCVGSNPAPELSPNYKVYCKDQPELCVCLDDSQLPEPIPCTKEFDRRQNSACGTGDGQTSRIGMVIEGIQVDYDVLGGDVTEETCKTRCANSLACTGFQLISSGTASCGRHSAEKGCGACYYRSDVSDIRYFASVRKTCFVLVCAINDPLPPSVTTTAAEDACWDVVPNVKCGDRSGREVTLSDGTVQDHLVGSERECRRVCENNVGCAGFNFVRSGVNSCGRCNREQGCGTCYFRGYPDIGDRNVNRDCHVRIQACIPGHQRPRFCPKHNFKRCEYPKVVTVTSQYACEQATRVQNGTEYTFHGPTLGCQVLRKPCLRLENVTDPTTGGLLDWAVYSADCPPETMRDYSSLCQDFSSACIKLASTSLTEEQCESSLRTAYVDSEILRELAQHLLVPYNEIMQANKTVDTLYEQLDTHVRVTCDPVTTYQVPLPTADGHTHETTVGIVVDYLLLMPFSAKIEGWPLLNYVVEAQYDPCADAPCVFGSCRANANTTSVGYICNCGDGWEGDNCDIERSATTTTTTDLGVFGVAATTVAPREGDLGLVAILVVVAVVVLATLAIVVVVMVRNQKKVRKGPSDRYAMPRHAPSIQGAEIEAALKKHLSAKTLSAMWSMSNVSATSEPSEDALPLGGSDKKMSSTNVFGSQATLRTKD